MGGRTGGAARGGRRRGRRVSTAARRDRARDRPATGGRVDARGPGGAGAGVPRPLRLRRAAVDAACSSPRPRSARATRCSPPGRDLRPAARRPAAAAGAHPGAAVAVAIGALRARAARRRRRRRAAAARPLGRARGRDRPRPLRAARRARALPRPRRVDAARALPRRHHCWRCSPRSPRSGRGAASSGCAHVALVLLVTLYAVPAVALDLSSRVPVAARCWRCSCVAYLRLERLRITDAGAAALLAVAVTILGLCSPRPRSTPTSRGSTTRRWALSNASSKSTAFSWDHSYGPLDWPRDGRELLRVKAKHPAYWKATNLDLFDGRRWRARPHARTNLDGCDVSAYLADSTAALAAADPRRRSATCARRRSSTAGVACPIDLAAAGLAAARRRHLREHEPRAAPWRCLRRARLHAAPQRPRAARAAAPTTRRRCSATPASSPPAAQPDPDPAARSTRSRPTSSSRCSATRAGRWRAAGDHRRGAEPARRRAAQRPLRAHLARSPSGSSAGSATQEDYVQAVLRYLAGPGFAYTESPPPAAENLDGFLFDAKSGYCQQYSGAMALLLRMGGVPARVSTGFTSGVAGPQGRRVRRARPRRALVGRGLVLRLSAG